MKNIKKILALTLGAATAVSMAGSLQADAAWGYVSDIVPDGYEQFDDHGLFKYIGYTGKKYNPYLVFWDKETHSKLKGFTYPQYNNLVLCVDNSAGNNREVYEIYHKYEEKLSFENFDEYDSQLQKNRHVMVFWDEHDADGNLTFDRNAIPDKTDIVKEFIDEIHATGLLQTASIVPASVICQDGWMSDPKSFSVEYSYATPEELYETVSKIDADLEVTATENEKKVVTLHVNGFKNIEDYLDAIGAIQEAYPIADVNVIGLGDDLYYGFFNSGNKLSKEINLMDPYICDIDGDGKVDVTDATQILSSYADNAAGILKAAESDAMDVNADGTVDIQDATYVLAYYAEAAAGLR